MMARLDPCLIFLIVACIRVYGIERNTMKKIKFKAYVYDLTDEDSHPLEIDLRAGRLWDVTSINFKDQIVEIMDDDGNTWEYELNDEIALVQYTGFKDKNSKEIYDGYIVSLKYLYDKRTTDKCQVVWREDKASFGLKSLKGLTNEAYELYQVTAEHNLEIIGNIYENPELLKG